MPSRTTRRTDIIPEEIVQRFTSGESTYALARSLKCDRSVIDRILLNNGIQPRNWSEAQYNRATKMTAEERAQSIAAAQAAWKGSIHTQETLEKIAQARYLNQNSISDGERELKTLLSARGIETEHQTPVGKYNIDLTCRDVGIEVLGGLWHKDKQHRSRTQYLLDQGWSIVFLWSSAFRYPLTDAAADYIARFIWERNNVGLDTCEYRVIRGNGKEIARGANGMNPLPGLPGND